MSPVRVLNSSESGFVLSSSIPGMVKCEPPNNRLHKFVGTLTWSGEEYSLDNEKLVLRVRKASMVGVSELIVMCSSPTHTWTCTHMWTCMHMYPLAHTHTHTRTHAHTYTYTHTCTHARTHMHAHTGCRVVGYVIPSGCMAWWCMQDMTPSWSRTVVRRIACVCMLYDVCVCLCVCVRLYVVRVCTCVWALS